MELKCVESILELVLCSQGQVSHLPSKPQPGSPGYGRGACRALPSPRQGALPLSASPPPRRSPPERHRRLYRRRCRLEFSDCMVSVHSFIRFRYRWKIPLTLLAVVAFIPLKGRSGILEFSRMGRIFFFNFQHLGLKFNTSCLLVCFVKILRTLLFDLMDV